MLRRKSIKKVPVFANPFCDPRSTKPLLHLLANREYTFSEEKEVSQKGQKFLFGKTSAGWLLIRGLDSYFESPNCPVCFCDAEDGDPVFELPCCKNKIHAECWMNQIKSGHFDRDSKEARKYDFGHLKCPCCRKMYVTDASDNTFRWSMPISSAVNKVDSNFWYDVWEKVMNVYRDVDYLISMKERGLPEEEKGGWAIFNCQRCTKLYIPGKMSCAEEMNLNLDEQEFVCPECEWQVEAKDHRCFKHGKKYAMFKCDSCCSIASWDCFYNHYCERCHNRACDKKFYPCPGGDKCPLGIPHPPNSQGVHGQNNFGFVIGCYKCMDPTYEPENYNEGAPDPFLVGQQENRGFELMFQYEARPEEEKLLVEQGLAGRDRPRPVPRAPPARRPIFEDSDEEDSSEPAYANFVAGFAEYESDSEIIDEEPINGVEWEFLQGFHSESDDDSEDESVEIQKENEPAEVSNGDVLYKRLVIAAMMVASVLACVSGYVSPWIVGFVDTMLAASLVLGPKVQIDESQTIDEAQEEVEEEESSSVLPFAEQHFMDGWGEESWDSEEEESSEEVEAYARFAEGFESDSESEEIEDVDEAYINFVAGFDSDSESDSESDVESDSEGEVHIDIFAQFLAGFNDAPYQNFLNGFESESESESETLTESESEPLWSTEEEDSYEVEQKSSPSARVPSKQSPVVLALLQSCSQECCSQDEPLMIPQMQVAESY